MQQSLKVRKFSPRKPRLNNLIKRLLPVFALLAYLFYLLIGPYGFINIGRLKREEINLRRQKMEFLEERTSLGDSLLMIKKDTFLLEKLAREKLGMIKPGDTVILLIE